MRRRFVLTVLCALLLSTSPVSAQTVTYNLAWDQPNASAADLPGYTFTLKVGAAAGAVVTPACVAGVPTKCQTPLPAGIGPATPILLTVSNVSGSASTSINSPASPGTPGSLTIIVKVTVP